MVATASTLYYGNTRINTTCLWEDGNRGKPYSSSECSPVRRPQGGEISNAGSALRESHLPRSFASAPMLDGLVEEDVANQRQQERQQEVFRQTLSLHIAAQTGRAAGRCQAVCCECEGTNICSEEEAHNPAGPLCLRGFMALKDSSK